MCSLQDCPKQLDNFLSRIFWNLWLLQSPRCKSIGVHIFKTTSSHEVNLRAEKILVNFYFVCFSYHMCTTKKHAPCDRLKITNHEPKEILHLIWASANLQKIPIYHPSGKYKLSICSFSEYFCYKIVFVQNNHFALPKKIFGCCMMQMFKNFFQP